MTYSPHHPASETALLFASPPWETPANPLLDALTPLDPLLGRSLLQRAVEHLVRFGARHLMVVIDDNATAVRNFLQNGERWGCRITYHYPDPNAPMGRFLSALGVTSLQHFWMGNAWSVPAEMPAGAASPHGAGTTLHWQENGEMRWTGWGCFSGAWLVSRQHPSQLPRLAEQIECDEWLEKTLVSAPVFAKEPASLLAGVRQILDAEGAVISKALRTHIHPTASLIAPCHIGKGVKIDAGAVIGPYAVIEENAYVAAGAHIHHSIVMPETYVGAELDLDCTIVRGSTLVNAALGSRTEISDPELLAHLHPIPRAARWATRAFATLLQGALFPVTLWLRRRHQLPYAADHHAVIPCPGRQPGGLGSLRVPLALPSCGMTNAPYDWATHFITTFYPGLGAIARGDLRFIGPSLRSWREASRLPTDWRRLHEDTPCGLLNDAWLQDPPAANSDEVFASDSLAAASPETPRRIISHVFRYLQQVWRHTFSERGETTSPCRHLNAV